MGRMSIKETNICFIIFMFSYVILSVIAAFLLPEDISYWKSCIISEAILIVPILTFILVKKISLTGFLQFSKIGLADVILAYAAAYCLLPFISLLNYITSFFSQNYVNDMMLEVYEYPLIMQLILIAFLPAVIEEYIFRGVFYTSYRRCTIQKGMLMSGLLFGMAHLNINQFVYAFFMGAAFCIIYEASGNAVLSMISHFAINAQTVFVMKLYSGMQELTETSGETYENGVGGISGAGSMEGIDSLETYTFADEMVFILILAAAAAIGIALFVLIINKIAKKHGRISLRAILKRGTENADVPDEKIMDIGMWAFTVAVFAYMILIEI